jgi:sugar phosphate isomerase/epimerase
MAAKKWHFPLSIQTALPDDFRENVSFQAGLRTLQNLGFAGVELNIADPDQADAVDIQEFLNGFDLRFTMFASGLTAKKWGLSLSSDDDHVRQKSIGQCRRMIDFASNAGAGIIIGFLKGPPANDAAEAQGRFVQSLEQITPFAEEKQVRVLVEATNRYESSVANNLADTMALIDKLGSSMLRILPDTFHMNIEEADSRKALKNTAGYYDSVHLSDNNRLFPGFGAVRFDEIIDTLKEIGFQGGLAIEGNIRTNFIDDVTASADFLIPLAGK